MDGRRDVIAPLIGRDLALFGWPRVAIHPSVCVCVFVGNHIEIEFVVFFYRYQAKIETRALKAKRPGFSEERYNETEYYFENGKSLALSLSRLDFFLIFFFGSLASVPITSPSHGMRPLRENERAMHGSPHRHRSLFVTECPIAKQEWQSRRSLLRRPNGRFEDWLSSSLDFRVDVHLVGHWNGKSGSITIS